MNRHITTYLLVLVLLAILIGGCGGSRHVASTPAASASIPPVADTNAKSSSTANRTRAHRSKTSARAAKTQRHHVRSGASTRHHAHPAARPGSVSPHSSPSTSAAPPGATTHHTKARESKRRHRHRTSSSRKLGPETVALRLHGGGNATVVACGASHHDKVYASGSTIHLTGAVTPVSPSHWKVKIKIKVCQNGAWVDMVKFQVPVNKRTGTFGGRFAAPAPGLYAATARLYITDVEAAKSLERHFEIP